MGDSVPGGLALALNGDDPFGDPSMQGYQWSGGGSSGGSGRGGGVPQAAEPPPPQMYTRSDSFRIEDWMIPPDIAKDGEDSDDFDGLPPEVLSSPMLSPPAGADTVGPHFAGPSGGGGGGVASAAGLDSCHQL